MRLDEQVGGETADPRIVAERHVGRDDARMEQAALIDDDAVGLRLDQADLLEGGVAGVGVSRQPRAIPPGGGDEGVAIGGCHLLDARRTLAVEGGAASLRIRQIMEDGQIAGIGRIEMRRTLRRGQGGGRGGDHREAALDPVEAVHLERAADERRDRLEQCGRIVVRRAVSRRQDASDAGIIAVRYARKGPERSGEIDDAIDVAGSIVDDDDRALTATDADQAWGAKELVQSISPEKTTGR